jgi:hypothetical protein
LGRRGLDGHRHRDRLRVLNRFEFLAASYFGAAERLPDQIDRWTWREELSKRVAERIEASRPVTQNVDGNQPVAAADKGG